MSNELTLENDKSVELTPECWTKWYAHKSNKEKWIEEQEREQENE